MMEDAHRGAFDVLAIWCLDRFGRDTLGNMLDVRELDRLGVLLVSCKEGWLDTATWDRPGTLLVAIFCWVAEPERERRSERTRAGMERVRAHGSKSGKPIGRPPRLDAAGLARVRELAAGGTQRPVDRNGGRCPPADRPARAGSKGWRRGDRRRPPETRCAGVVRGPMDGVTNKVPLRDAFSRSAGDGAGGSRSARSSSARMDSSPPDLARANGPSSPDESRAVVLDAPSTDSGGGGDLSLAQASRMLGVPETTLRRRIDDGDLPATKDGRSFRRLSKTVVLQVGSLKKRDSREERARSVGRLAALAFPLSTPPARRWTRWWSRSRPTRRRSAPCSGRVGNSAGNSAPSTLRPPRPPPARRSTTPRPRPQQVAFDTSAQHATEKT